jgi:predicted ribosomally synthesized peptide with SipW-like signal peptide
MSRTLTKVLITTAIVGVLGSLAGLGVLGAFSSTTQSSGNEVTAGSVSLSNNSAGQALFSVQGANPGTSLTHCIKVTYSGSLPADVHIYLGGTPGALAPYLNLKIEEGTTSGADVFPACTTFTAVDTLYDGPITPDSFSYDTGLPTYPGGVAGAWTAGSSTVYRITATLASNAPNTGQAQSTGILTAFWEAHNQ